MQTPHKLRCVGWLLAMLTLLGGRLCAQSGSDFSDELYLDSWNQVVGITYDSTGIMYVWEKGGRVYVVNDSVRQSTPLLDISEEVGSWGAHGMLGFALDPAYLTNGRIYVLYAVDRHHLLYFGTPSYSASANIINNATIGRITRYTVVNPGDPTNAYVDYNTRQILLGATAEDGFPITANTHGVGSLLFGTDGTLLASCGDGAFPSGEDFGSQPETWYLQALADGILNDTTNCGAYRAQSLHSLSGKLLRIDPETGEGLASNPYYDPTEPSSVQSRIWALGLRQPFRMTLMPGTGGHYPSEGDPGVVVIGDVGSGNREEINICNQPGLNFGWPLYEGMGTMSSYYNQIEPNLAAPTPGGCGQSYYSYQDLIYDGTSTPNWPDPCGGGEIASTQPRMVHQRPRMDYRSDIPRATKGGTTYDIGSPEFAGSYFDGSCVLAGFQYTGTDFPEYYQNSYFFADYADGWIRRLKFNATYEVDSVFDFIDVPGTIVGLFSSPVDGGLYYLNFENEIRKVRFVGNNNRRPTAVITKDTAYAGGSSLTVNFDATNSTDTETAPLTYLWDFGDGLTDSSAITAHVFTAPDTAPITYEVTLTVTDTGGLSHTVYSNVWLNNTPPQLLSTSIDTVDYYAMDTPTPLELTADVMDAEHAYDSLSFVWQAFLYHDTHNHPEPKVYHDSAFFEITPIGCETYAVYWYEIEFTVTDPEGLATKFVKEIHPNCDVPVAFADEANYIRGQEVAIDVLDNDLIYDGADLSTLAIVDGPQHGSAVADVSTGLIRYTHDGTLSDVDSLTYQIADADGTVSAPGTVRLSRLPSPTIDMLTPVDGTVAEDDRETVTYQLGGNENVIHGILFKSNGTVIGHDSLLRGFFRLTDIPPGNYQLKASLLDADGQEFGIPETEDSASVTYVALGSSFAHAMDITIHASEVMGSTPHENFPVMFSLVDPSLRHTSMGGNIEHIEARDLAFRLGDGTTLDHEIERYEPSSGELIAWVRIPSLSPTTDTELEMIYGSPGYDRVLSTPYAWADNYVGRWHMNPDIGGGLPEMYDGTANDHDGSAFGGMSNLDVVSGIAGQGVRFDGSDDYMDLGGYATPGDRFTLSAWVQSAPSNTGNHGVVGFEGLGACCGSRAPSILVRQATRVRAGFSDGAGFNFLTTPYNVVDASGSGWSYLTMTYDGITLRIMVDGVTEVSSTNYAGSQVASSPVRNIGRMDANFFAGVIDEVSLSSTARSEDWTRTEYHNLTRPDDFFTAAVGTPPNTGQPLISLSSSEALNYVQALGSTSTRTVTVGNSGTATLYDVQISVSGSSDFSADPALIDSISVGQTVPVSVDFSPSAAGPQFEVLTATSTDSSVVARTLPIRGLGQDGPSSLQWLVDFHLGPGNLSVGDDDPSSLDIHSDSALRGSVLLGDAVEARHFTRANESEPVSLSFVAAGLSSVDTVAVLGYTEPFTSGIFHESYATDSLLDLMGNSFVPTLDTFGLGVRWPSLANRLVYSDDTLNTFVGANPHHIRSYPLPGEPHAYLLAIEAEGNSHTYQDLVLIARNLSPVEVVMPSDSVPADTTPGDTTIFPPGDTLTGGVAIYRVDAGGTGQPALDDGPGWERDTRWEPVSHLVSDPTGHRAANSVKTSYTSDIDTSTTNLDIFYYHRWDRGSGDNMRYSFAVDPGMYELRLYLAEGEAGYGPGDRVFSVDVEGSVPPIFQDIDLAAEYGPLVGGVKSYALSVMDGSLDLEFMHGAAGTPLVNGIEILAGGDSTGQTPPAGQAEMTFSTREIRMLESAGQSNLDHQVVITNTGTDTLDHTDILIAGPDAAYFSCWPIHVHYVPPGDSIVVDITYSPLTPGGHLAWLEVGPHDTTVAREIVDIHAWTYVGEPSLSMLAEYWYGTGTLDVGDDNLATTVIHSDPALRVAPLLGEEVGAQVFTPADSLSPVTFEWRALHDPGSVVDTAVILSWHPWHTPDQAQSLSALVGPQRGVSLTGSDGSFLAGEEPFGLVARWPGIGQRRVHTIDSLNAFGHTAHQVRSYPIPHESDAYLIAFDARESNYEYQDLILVARNLTPATVVMPPPDSTPSGSSLIPIYRIDAGGTGIAAIDGGIDWDSDTRWVPSPYLASDPADSRANSFTLNAYDESFDPTTHNPEIFYYERWDRRGGDDIMYDFPLSAPGFYEVRTYLSNAFSSSTLPGQRIFSVEIEGMVPSNMSNVDPTALFGHLVGGVLSHTVYVGDGTLNLRLLRNLGNPSINAIEVLELSGTASREAQSSLPNPEAASNGLAMAVYPNPTLAGQPTVIDLVLPVEQTVVYRLYDGQGRQVRGAQEHFTGQQARFKVSRQGLPAGVYLLRVSGKDWQKSQPLIIWE